MWFIRSCNSKKSGIAKANEAAPKDRLRRAEFSLNPGGFDLSASTVAPRAQLKSVVQKTTALLGTSSSRRLIGHHRVACDPDMFPFARPKYRLLAFLLLFPLAAAAGVDLVVNHTDSPDPVAAGGVVTYTVTVANSSFDTGATGVNTTHSVPAGAAYQGFAGAGVSCAGMVIGAAGPGVLNCTLPNLAANNDLVTFTIQLKTTAQGTITLGATAASIEADDQPLNNIDPESTTVNSGANLVMNKTPAAASGASGSSFSWALSVTNNGPDAATHLVVQDPVPTGFNVTAPARRVQQYRRHHHL